MKTENLIAVSVCCTSYNIESSFIHSLEQNGLLALVTIEDTAYIEQHALKQLEQIISLHYELEINLAGIETIMHLLQRVNTLQEEVLALHNKLRVYEVHPLSMEIIE